MSLVMGFDPGINKTGYGILHVETDSWTDFGVLESGNTGYRAVKEIIQRINMFAPPQEVVLAMVESQEYHGSDKFKPKNIIKLATVSGAIAGLFDNYDIPYEFVAPSEWKHSVPKNIHHKQLLDAWGWKYKVANTKQKHVIPLDYPYQHRLVFSKEQWRDILDGMGIAKFAAKKLKFDNYTSSL